MTAVAWLWLLAAVCAGGALLLHEDRGGIRLAMAELLLLLWSVAMFAKEVTR